MSKREQKEAVSRLWEGSKLTLNPEKTKCMLVGSNRKLESRMALTVSIFDHNVNNVNSFKCLGMFTSSGQIMLKTLLAKLVKGLICFKH